MQQVCLGSMSSVVLIGGWCVWYYETIVVCIVVRLVFMSWFILMIVVYLVLLLNVGCVSLNLGVCFVYC